MIKPVQQRQPQQPSTPVSSAQGKGKTEAVDSKQSMLDCAANVNSLATFLPFGAGGKHNFSYTPAAENVTNRTQRAVNNCI